MTWLSGELVGLLTFLLPGFVAVAIFHSLTSHPKPSAFDRVIQALIFTVIVQSVIPWLLLLFNGDSGGYANWGEDLKLGVSVSGAVILGLIATYVFNNDSLHKVLRWLRVTKETSYSSEWYRAFSKFDGSYVILNLASKRRLYGWPEEWPSAPDSGHFSIAEPEWLAEDENGHKEKKENGHKEKKMTDQHVSAILIPVTEVEMVEFVRNEDPEGTQD